jgi:inner membrane protein
MPSAISHIIAGSSVGYALYRGEKGPRFWISLLVLSLIPDLDVLAFQLGIGYSHPLGHRGFFHSLVFALILGVTFALMLRRGHRGAPRDLWRLALAFSLVASLHPLLDAMTNGGLGIGLFIPFDNRRYFLPWTPIVVSPLSIAPFFSKWGIDVLKSELKWVIAPSISLVFIALLIRRVKRSDG